MRNIKMVISYDGTDYHGFQRQKNAVTIQEVIENALCQLSNQDIKITGAARTDAGVHAIGQVVNFFANFSIPAERIPFALQTMLPQDIVVSSAVDVSHDFHARYSAKGKTYEYKIYQAYTASPFMRNFAWRIKETLNLQAMQQAAQYLIGTHDFSSFRASGSTPTNPVRTIYYAGCRKKENELIITLTGDGFLYHMVRNIVGTLVDVGLNKISFQQFIYILESKDRKMAGKTAPANGLYLKEVHYDDSIIKNIQPYSSNP